MTFSVGLDIGGTSVKLGLVRGECEVVARRSIPTLRGVEADELVRALAEAVRDLTRGAVEPQRITSIGIGCAGLIDVERGVIGLSPNLPAWRDVPLRDLLARATGLPVSLINDADAFGYAEGKHGAGRGCRAGLFATLGTGVGGSILLDGQFVRGAHGVAGEIGHMSIDLEGPPCACGGRGCLEKFVGNAHIVERALRKIRNGAPGAAIIRAAGGPDAPITPKAIAEAAFAGDWTARAVWTEIGTILGTALAGVTNLLGLDMIVLGGGVAGAGDVLFTPTRETVHERCMFPAHQKPPVVPSRFGVDAGLIGASAFARDRRPA